MDEPKDDRSEKDDDKGTHPLVPAPVPVFVPGSSMPLGAIVPIEGDTERRDEASDDYLDGDADDPRPDE